MDDRYREALRAHMFEHQSFEEIERRLGLPFDDSIMARLLQEATTEMGFVPRSPLEPLPGVVEPLPDAFTTGDGTEIVLLRVPAEEATSTWESLLADAPSSGQWPVILSQRYGGGILQLLEEPAGFMEHAGGIASTQAVLDKARTLNGRVLLDKAWQSFFEYEEEEELMRGPLSDSPPARHLPPIPARLIPNTDSAIIGLFPCNDSFEIPAILGYGGWNGSPAAAEHVAVLRYWQQHHHEARLQALSLDTIELIVGNPPSEGEQALAVARDHFSYASDIPSDTMYGTVGDLASVLPISQHWHFWWD